MTLGKQLQMLREKENLSREQLGEKLNVSRQAIYKWESDKGYPDIENLIRLSEFYNVTLDELLKKQSSTEQVAEDKSESELYEEEKEADDLKAPSDPGFVVGLILIVGSVFLDLGVLSTILLVIGLGTMVFYDEIVEVFQAIRKDFSQKS